MFLGIRIVSAAMVFAACTTVFAADGAAIWTTHCAKCHGETGAADTAVGKALKAPTLSGNAKVASMTTADLVAAIKASKKHAGLKVADADLEAAAAHAKELAAKK